MKPKPRRTPSKSAAKGPPKGAGKATPQGTGKALPKGAAKASPKGAVKALPKGAAKALPKGAVREVLEPRIERPHKQKPPPPKRAVALVPGDWLCTTREGSEQDLVDELLVLNVKELPQIIAPALVSVPGIPKRDRTPVELTFARQGFPVADIVESHDLDELIERLVRGLVPRLTHAEQYALHVWVPDSKIGNPLSGLAEEVETQLAARIASALPRATRVDDSALRRMGSIPFAQVCLVEPSRAVSGVSHSNQALSLARGGRTRVRVTGELPSRAARKLEEALAWINVAPSAGDVCVDLGAAPGGWTYVLLERKARVIAVDPAYLRPDIAAHKHVRHVKDSAFTFAPDEPVDWLFCDMAWRPLEVAALLARWGRKRWARMLVANIKLPMTKKAEILARVKGILQSEGQWKHIRTKQLYHDRDEITLVAHLG